MSGMLKFALRYLELGFHPVPCPPREKRPMVAWKDFQTVAPTTEQVTEWWTKTPDANIALVLKDYGADVRSIKGAQQRTEEAITELGRVIVQLRLQVAGMS